MWQINFCPRCGARTACGDRFCGACGLDLARVARLVPPPSYDYQCAYQQWVQHSPEHAQASPANSSQYRQRYARMAGDTVTPISAEISKLLADFFSGSARYNKA